MRQARSPITVRVRNHQRQLRVGPYLQHRPIHRAVRETLRREPSLRGQAVEVSVALVDDLTIAELNARFRGQPEPTDVLSFGLDDASPDAALPEPDPGGARLLGEIVINAPRAVEQAREYGHSVERELAYLAVHGCLHLLGYDHQDEESKRAMRSREEAALSACGLFR